MPSLDHSIKNSKSNIIKNVSIKLFLNIFKKRAATYWNAYADSEIEKTKTEQDCCVIIFKDKFDTKLYLCNITIIKL